MNGGQFSQYYVFIKELDNKSQLKNQQKLFFTCIQKRYILKDKSTYYFPRTDQIFKS